MRAVKETPGSIYPELRYDFEGWAELTTTVETAGGRKMFTLTADRLDAEAQHFFGRGFCHWLAGAIHCLTGWELITYDRQQPTGEWKPAHTAVLTPNGRVLDIFGEFSPEEVVQRYQQGGYRVRTRKVSNEHMPGDVVEGVDDLRGDPFWWARTCFKEPVATGVVTHFARVLLDRYGHNRHITNGAHLHTRQPTRTTVTTPSPAPNPPASPATTTTPATSTTLWGGNTMIEQVRHAIAMSTDKAQTIAGMLQQATTEIGEIQALLSQALQGSTSAEAHEVLGIFAQLTEQLMQSSQAIHPAVDALNSYAARL